MMDPRKMSAAFVHQRKAPASSGPMMPGSHAAEDHPRKRVVRLPNTVALIIIFALCAFLVYVSSLYDHSLSSMDNYSSIDENSDEGRFYRESWRQIQELVNETTALTWPFVRGKLHPLQDYPKYRNLEYHPHLDQPSKDKIWRDSEDPFIYTGAAGVCQAAKVSAIYGSQKRHVLLTILNENTGAFSHYVPNRTTELEGVGSDTDAWARRDGGCTVDGIIKYLDDPNTLGVVTTQHHAFDHPKAHSLPIGTQGHTFNVMYESWISNPERKTLHKTQLLMINNSVWRHRKSLTARVIDNFTQEGHKNVVNSYCREGYKNGKRKRRSTCPRNQRELFVTELARSKFTLCPSGLGWDSYRIWEALTMLTIPIIERFDRPNDGWRRTLDKLPILWVDHVEDVTPSLLEKEYARIVGQGSESYEWPKLTRTYWLKFIESLAEQ